MHNFILYGHGGSGNHGCEAIVRSLIKIVNNIGSYDMPLLMAARGFDDIQYEIDKIASVSKVETINPSPTTAFLHAYLRLKLLKQYEYLDTLPYIYAVKNDKKKYSLALSIGGDNYCYGDTSNFACINRSYNKLGILKPIDYTSIEALRKRGVKIGENVDILNSLIDGGHGALISIGNNVTITGVRVLSHDASTKKFLGYSKVGLVEIGDNVFIGQGSIILPNTKIGNNVIVGAGTVVAKDVPDNVVIAGNPWRILCTFDEYIERNRVAMQSKPVFNKVFTEKTKEDWDQMVAILRANGGAGYDL